MAILGRSEGSNYDWWGPAGVGGGPAMGPGWQRSSPASGQETILGCWGRSGQQSGVGGGAAKGPRRRGSSHAFEELGCRGRGEGWPWTRGRAGSRRCSGRQEAARLGRRGLQALHAQEGPQHPIRRHIRAQVLVGRGAAEAAALGSPNIGIRAAREDPPQQVPAARGAERMQ